MMDVTKVTKLRLLISTLHETRDELRNPLRAWENFENGWKHHAFVFGWIINGKSFVTFITCASTHWFCWTNDCREPSTALRSFVTAVTKLGRRCDETALAAAPVMSPQVACQIGAKGLTSFSEHRQRQHVNGGSKWG
jgi:hypothetical protein